MFLISKICFWNKNHISIFIFKFRQGFFFFFSSSQFSLHMGEANPLAVTDRSSDSTVRGKKRRINDSSTGETFLLRVFRISLSSQPVITDANSLKKVLADRWLGRPGKHRQRYRMALALASFIIQIRPFPRICPGGWDGPQVDAPAWGRAGDEEGEKRGEGPLGKAQV